MKEESRGHIPALQLFSRGVFELSVAEVVAAILVACAVLFEEIVKEEDRYTEEMGKEWQLEGGGVEMPGWGLRDAWCNALDKYTSWLVGAERILCLR